jgi:hypothetical protein
MKNYSIFTVENALGFILALLIIFQILPSLDIANLINNPIGVIIRLIIVVVLFLMMNPIVGFLLLIYLYQIIQLSNNSIKKVFPITRNNDLYNLNKPQPDQLEEVIIKNVAPIKNQYQGNNVPFYPYLEKITF